MQIQADIVFVVTDPVADPRFGDRLFVTATRNPNMLSNAISEYISPSLPQRVEVELRIRLKR